MSTQKGIPGFRAGVETTPRSIVASFTPRPQYIGGVMDATFAFDGANTGKTQQLRPGTPMARITATGLWIPCKRTQVNMTGATATAITVDDARAFQVGDEVTIGGDAGLEITAINYTTNVITITSTTVADNDVVFVDLASQVGGEICRGFLDEFVDLVDEDNTARDRQLSKILVAGSVNHGMILGDLAAIRAMVEGTTKFTNQISWTDQQGFDAETDGGG